MKKTIAQILFLLVFLAEMYAIIFDNQLVMFVAKPMLMVSLAIFYLVSVSKPNFWYVSALFFSFWGDSLLLFKDEYFVLGLASFLLAHLSYITISSKYLQQVSLNKIILHSLPFVIFLVLLMNLIYPNLDAMFIPVLVYGIVISVFGAVTYLVFSMHKSTANLWLFLGALLFIASDSVLAINKFYESQEIYQVLIMITYITAQFLICKAIIAKSN